MGIVTVSYRAVAAAQLNCLGSTKCCRGNNPSPSNILKLCVFAVLAAGAIDLLEGFVTIHDSTMFVNNSVDGEGGEI